MPQYWKMSAFSGEAALPCTIGGELLEIPHADEMLLCETGRKNDLRNVCHTCFIKNDQIKPCIPDSTVDDGLGNGGRNKFCCSDGFFFLLLQRVFDL